MYTTVMEYHFKPDEACIIWNEQVISLAQNNQDLFECSYWKGMENMHWQLEPGNSGNLEYKILC